MKNVSFNKSRWIITKSRWIITAAMAAFILHSATILTGFQVYAAEVTPTPLSMDLFGYITGATIGDRLEVYDGDGILCGSFSINKEGQYGFMPVYGDDRQTPEDEGANYGDRLSFTFNGAPVFPASNMDVFWTGDREQQRVDFNLE